MVLCGVACAFLLVSGDNGQTGAASRLDFDTIVREARDAGSLPDWLIRELQYAEQSFVRWGDTDEVVERFQRLRDRLIGSRATIAAEAGDDLEKLLGFVQLRLDQMR